ncbi:MAG: hypothetical protein KF862_22895 [Chitinophagaceae bacterium]|nr:hypothetical protein [Chitinophagaceae bacterium]
MAGRLQKAVDKISFCYRHTADIGSFLKLLVNTKKRKRKALSKGGNEKPVQYHFILNSLPRNIYLRTYNGDISIHNNSNGSSSLLLGVKPFPNPTF